MCIKGTYDVGTHGKSYGKEFSRIQRINQQVQRELAFVLQREIKDPRLGMVTVTEVDVSKDLNYAKVYVTFFGLDDTSVEEKIVILNHAMPYVRSLMASRVNLRVIPEFDLFMTIH